MLGNSDGLVQCRFDLLTTCWVDFYSYHDARVIKR